MDNLHVTRFINVCIMTIHQLKHLAFRNDVRRVGEYLHHAHIVDLNHHLKSAGVEEIANQYTGRVSEHGIRCFVPPPQGRLVHNIVMKQRCSMDKFDNRCQFMMIGTLIPKCTSNEQYQGGTHSLATTTNNVLGNLADKNYVRMKTFADDRINGLHIGPNQGIKLFQCHVGKFPEEARNLRWPRLYSQGRLRTAKASLDCLFAKLTSSKKFPESA
ncbi:MAG: hypothetical protein H6R14_2689 [Proteobacteria bacterium]|nr:hypothetical protein [Pseudomonadota bacterium]